MVVSEPGHLQSFFDRQCHQTIEVKCVGNLPIEAVVVRNLPKCVDPEQDTIMKIIKIHSGVSGPQLPSLLEITTNLVFLLVLFGAMWLSDYW